jgi:hypothetical protein
MLDIPPAVDQLTVHCEYCQRTVELPDRDKRIVAQQRKRQADQSQALVQDHLRSARAMQRRITLLVLSILFVTMGLVFYRVFVGGTR